MEVLYCTAAPVQGYSIHRLEIPRNWDFRTKRMRISELWCNEMIDLVDMLMETVVKSFIYIDPEGQDRSGQTSRTEKEVKSSCLR